MSFTLDPARCYLSIEEPNLIALQRSSNLIVPTAENLYARPCEAFICSCREYNLYRVFIALYDPQFKSNLVFVADPVEPDFVKLDLMVAEAVEFVTAMGFEMLPINLAFSPATREVVMKDNRVFREPSSAIRLEAAMAAVEALNKEKNDLARKVALGDEASLREIECLKLELKNLQQQLEENRSCVIEFDHDILEATQSELCTIRQEAEELREKLQLASAHSQEAHKSVKAMRTKLHNAQQAQKNEAAQVKALEKEVFRLREDLEQANLTALSALKEKEELNAQLSSLDRAKASEANAATAALLEQLDELRATIFRLNEELNAARLAASGELEALRAALQVSEENLRAERAKNESALQEMDALERNAAIELKSLKKKIQSLVTEKQLLESMAVEFRHRSEEEIQRLKKENLNQRRAAVKKVAALKEEMRLLAEARVEITSPFGGLTAALDANERNRVQLPETATLPANDAAPADPFDPSRFVEYISFEPDQSLSGIPYADASDIITLYRSFNRLQAAPDGRIMQPCDGFVCLVKGEGGHKVYAAWWMSSTEEVLVCRPAAAAVSKEDVERIVQEGIGYFERIGFMIDPVDLEHDRKKKERQLQNLPVFRQTALDHAA